jgi:hypothetical protein
MGLLFSSSHHNLFVLESSLLRTYYESRLFLWVKRQCLCEVQALIWVSANLCFSKYMENGLLFLRLRIAGGPLIKGLFILTSMRANLYLWNFRGLFQYFQPSIAISFIFHSIFVRITPRFAKFHFSMISFNLSGLRFMINIFFSRFFEFR